MRRRTLFKKKEIIPTLTLSSTSGTINNSGGTKTFTALYNGIVVKDYSIIVTCDSEWVSTSYTISNGNIRLSCGNNVSSTRYAYINVTYNGLTARYQLKQNSGSWRISPTSSSIKYSQTATRFNIIVNGSTYTGTDYTISESLDWVTTTKSGGTVNVSMTQNTSENVRNGVITINYQGFELEYQIIQSGVTFTIEHEMILTHGESNSSGATTTYITDGGVTSQYNGVLTLSSDQSWASPSRRTGALADGLIRVTATSPNQTSSPRFATITATFGEQSKTIIFAQMPQTYNTIDGYTYVDMGSGLKWATNYVGATNEIESNNYYQWGAGGTTYQNTDQFYTGDTILPLSVDTARQVMGGNWRMPTKEEAEMLNNACEFYHSTFDRVDGYAIKSITNNNIIFTSNTGYYSFTSKVEGIGRWWTSTNAKNYSPQDKGSAYNVTPSTVTYWSRSVGLPIRGVQ